MCVYVCLQVVWDPCDWPGRCMCVCMCVCRQAVLDSIELYESGLIAPHVSAQFPLDQVNEALSFISERRSTGKVLLDIRWPDLDLTSTWPRTDPGLTATWPLASAVGPRGGLNRRGHWISPGDGQDFWNRRLFISSDTQWSHIGLSIIPHWTLNYTTLDSQLHHIGHSVTPQRTFGYGTSDTQWTECQDRQRSDLTRATLWTDLVTWSRARRAPRSSVGRARRVSIWSVSDVSQSDLASGSVGCVGGGMVTSPGLRSVEWSSCCGVIWPGTVSQLSVICCDQVKSTGWVRVIGKCGDDRCLDCFCCVCVCARLFC